MTSRGGCGKTSLSHALALGAAWRNVEAHLCHTDSREPIHVIDRPYHFYDARNQTTLSNIIDSALTLDAGLIVVDSGGNRHELDTWLAQSMDLIIIPLAPDAEDVREAIAHAQRLTLAGAANVKFVVNKWPNGERQQSAAKLELEGLPKADLLCRVPIVSAIKVLRADDSLNAFKTPTSKVNNIARALYRAVKAELERNAC